MSGGPSTPINRIVALDVARGLALVGMGIYHLGWDLAYFGLAPPSLPYSWRMRVFSHVVAGAFLALVGVSLSVAHRAGPNWRAFIKRLTIVAGAAALVSVATFFGAPQAPIFFGILHCIAAASLIGALFLSAPAWAALVAGAAAVAAPLVYSSDLFNPAALLWLGLGTREPAALDWRPLLPWAGVALVGLGFAKLVPPGSFGSPFALWRPRAAPGRALAFAGRHSLAVYLVHQPILFALLYAGTQWTGVAARREAERYLAACRPACVQTGGDSEMCAKACACVVRKATDAGLAKFLTSRADAAADRAEVSAIVEACGSEAR